MFQTPAVLTSDNGAPIMYSDAHSSLNRNLINHEYFMNIIGHITRERIPERLNHAKGTGAFGYFECTANISHIIKSRFLEKIGKKTPVAVRLSTNVGNRGSSDLSREARGFAVKFYTEEGNLDLIGFNTPIYVYKDPIHFTTFVHSPKRNPATFLADMSMFWDAVTLVPESMFFAFFLFGDGGIPAGYRHMPGFPIHTYQVENKKGEMHYVRFHFTPDAGLKHLTSQEAATISGSDPDYLSRGLYKDIANKNYPSWSVGIQILTQSDVDKEGSQVFDTTRYLPENKYPKTIIGKLVLNRNFKNYHNEVERMGFSVANLVPGILGSPGTLFEGRRLAYRDAQNYRLGVNHQKIVVNCPFNTKVATYNVDGVAPVGDNNLDAPNYYPNSFHGPEPIKQKRYSKLLKITEKVGPDNFDQAAKYYDGLTDDEQDRLTDNIAASLQQAVDFIQDRTIKLFKKIHPGMAEVIKEKVAALTECS